MKVLELTSFKVKVRSERLKLRVLTLLSDAPKEFRKLTEQEPNLALELQFWLSQSRA